MLKCGHVLKRFKQHFKLTVYRNTQPVQTQRRAEGLDVDKAGAGTAPGKEGARSTPRVRCGAPAGAAKLPIQKATQTGQLDSGSQMLRVLFPLGCPSQLSSCVPVTLPARLWTLQWGAVAKGLMHSNAPLSLKLVLAWREKKKKSVVLGNLSFHSVSQF